MEKTIKEFNKQLDKTWKVTNHYILWGDWVKHLFKKGLFSQQNEIIEKIKDVKNRTLKHKGGNKRLDDDLNRFASIIFDEIINVIEE